MLKRAGLAVLAVFVIGSLLDFVLHGILLRSTYEATANLWRPMKEMNLPLIYVVMLVFAACFVAIYTFLVDKKSLWSGIRLGFFFGLTTGVSMGFGSYSYMPIPMTLAVSWFLGSVIEITIAGAIVGAIMRD
ncbi:conserved membrane hypothetical protein [Gammaproteobacteria bacterium]